MVGRLPHAVGLLITCVLGGQAVGTSFIQSHELVVEALKEWSPATSDHGQGQSAPPSGEAGASAGEIHLSGCPLLAPDLHKTMVFKIPAIRQPRTVDPRENEVSRRLS